jgi:hypothetical protein
VTRSILGQPYVTVVIEQPDKPTITTTIGIIGLDAQWSSFYDDIVVHSPAPPPSDDDEYYVAAECQYSPTGYCNPYNDLNWRWASTLLRSGLELGLSGGETIQRILKSREIVISYKQADAIWRAVLSNQVKEVPDGSS